MDLEPSLKQVIANADNSSFSRYFYSVKSGLDKLLGKHWQCSYFEDFYLPSQKVVPMSLAKVIPTRIDPNAADVIVIMLASDNTVLINNSALRDISKFRPALVSTLDGRAVDKLEVVLYLDSGADAGQLAGIFSTMADVGIENIKLIEYSSR